MTRKHNHKMATRPLRLHPFERQRLRQIWSERSVNAGIHALTGDDVGVIVGKVGTLFYVVLGAAMGEGIAQDAPDMRILRATVNTLADCVDQPEITHQQRASLSSGMEALKRLIAGMAEESLFIAATHAQAKLNNGPVTLADFEAFGHNTTLRVAPPSVKVCV